MSKTIKYIYTPNVLLKFVKDYTERSIFSEFRESGTKPTTHNIRHLIDNITDELYFIVPNPASSFKLLVYDPLDTDTAYYCIYDKSIKTRKQLKKDYKEYMLAPNRFTDIYKVLDYDKLINSLYIYEEEKISNQTVLLKNGYVYNNKDMVFTKEAPEIPIKYVDKEYKKLTKEHRDILGTVFNIMYPNPEEYDKFLYYILSMSNKKYAEQSIFLIIDKSKVGKTAKISPLIELQISSMADSGILKSTELYNIFFNNSVTINEVQSDNINGSNLNNLADTSAYTVTRKNKDSLTVTKEDKPVISIMGESQPYIKALSDGTNRRFILVPKVDKEFITYKNKPENKEIIDKFYSLLYNNFTEVIEFYSKQIDIHNIKSKTKEIKESMLITPAELEKLIEVKEDIFSRYFNLNPEYNNELTEITYLIDSAKGLDILLKYIDNHIATVNHIGTAKGRKKYLNQLIKEETGAKNLKEFGITKKSENKKLYNIYYAYSLTDKGVKLVDEINKTLAPEEKIYYTNIFPPKEV